MKLVISLATRGRPAQLADTIAKSLANWASPETVVMVGLDSDDADTLNWLSQYSPHAWFVGPAGPRVIFDVREREDTIAAKWNRALAIPADLYLVAADDDPYITPGYDLKLLEAAQRFPDGIGVVYGRMANASFSGVVAPTLKMTQKLGHIFPEYFPYWFVDHWLDDIVRMIGRISFADVATDQSRAGRTQEMREPAWWATFYDAAFLVRRKIAHDILIGPDFDGPDWNKHLLAAQAPLIEHRSRWINDQVRGNAKGLEWQSRLSLKDERYQRLKAKAQALVPAFLEGMDAAEAQRFREVLLVPDTITALPRVG